MIQREFNKDNFYLALGKSLAPCEWLETIPFTPTDKARFVQQRQLFWPKGQKEKHLRVKQRGSLKLNLLIWKIFVDASLCFIPLSLSLPTCTNEAAVAIAAMVDSWQNNSTGTVRWNGRHLWWSQWSRFRMYRRRLCCKQRHCPSSLLYTLVCELLLRLNCYQGL